MAELVDCELLCCTLVLLQGTGVYKDEIKSWKAKGTVEKTWPNFVIFFTEKHMDWREEQQQSVGRIAIERQKQQQQHRRRLFDTSQH